MKNLTPWVLHADTVRSHVANLCPTCHPSDCYVCGMVPLLPAETQQ